MAFVDYHKIVLFGDSITEQSYEQTRYALPLHPAGPELTVPDAEVASALELQ